MASDISAVHSLVPTARRFPSTAQPRPRASCRDGGHRTEAGGGKRVGGVMLPRPSHLRRCVASSHQPLQRLAACHQCRPPPYPTALTCVCSHCSCTALHASTPCCARSSCDDHAVRRSANGSAFWRVGMGQEGEQPVTREGRLRCRNVADGIRRPPPRTCPSSASSRVVAMLCSTSARTASTLSMHCTVAPPFPSAATSPTLRQQTSHCALKRRSAASIFASASACG